MEIKLELAKREVGGEYFLVPLGKSVYTHNGIFVLTELGAFIWDILPSVESPQEILERVLEEYEVEPSTAEKDINDFLTKLTNLGIL